MKAEWVLIIISRELIFKFSKRKLQSKQRRIFRVLIKIERTG